MTDTDSRNARMVNRIDDWLAQPGEKTRYSDEDERVLRYIRSQLTLEGYENRPDDDKTVGHLHDVARLRLTPYSKENEHDHPSDS